MKRWIFRVPEKDKKEVTVLIIQGIKKIRKKRKMKK
jgi:hypothetical protein